MVVFCSERQRSVIDGRRQNLMKAKKYPAHRNRAVCKQGIEKTEITGENRKCDSDGNKDEVGEQERKEGRTQRARRRVPGTTCRSSEAGEFNFFFLKGQKSVVGV